MPRDRSLFITSRTPFALASCLALAASCAPAPTEKQAAKPMPADVVATVNGAPITGTDVRLKLKGNVHQPAPEQTPEATKNVIDLLVKQELAAQKAVELGYDRDPTYLERVREKEAELAALRRTELAETYYRRALAEKATPTDAEVQKYYDENASRIRTELHVFQIFRRDEPTIRDVEKRLAAGETFEAIAESMFPKLPDTEKKPWDLGYLAWKQIPDAWVSTIYALQPGQTSGVIKSGKDRFWILKLVDKRENTSLTLEAVKPVVVKALEEKKIEEKRAELDAQLEGKAKVTYTTPAGGK